MRGVRRWWARCRLGPALDKVENRTETAEPSRQGGRAWLTLQRPCEGGRLICFNYSRHITSFPQKRSQYVPIYRCSENSPRSPRETSLAARQCNRAATCDTQHTSQPWEPSRRLNNPSEHQLTRASCPMEHTHSSQRSNPPPRPQQPDPLPGHRENKRYRAAWSARPHSNIATT